MTSPKVVVIGAGSFFFGRPVIWNMVHSPILRGGTLALVDTDPKVLKTYKTLAEKTIAATKSPTKLIASTDRRKVLKDADFVILSFSDRNAHHRKMDCEIALKYGVRMCSGDTIGSGGIFRACREIPKALDMARDIEALAPNAWTINFVNPTTVLGIALMRYAPNVRSFAICDGLHEPYYRVKMLKAVGILPKDAPDAIPPAIERDLQFWSMGVNHFTWVTRFEYKGKDYLPAWRKVVAEQSKRELDEVKAQSGGLQSDNNATSKAKFNATYSLQLMDIFNAFPDRIGHTKEYVPFYQGHGQLPNQPTPLAIFDADERTRKMQAHYDLSVAYATGKKPIKEFIAEGRGDHATDIIEGMWGNLGKTFYVNTPNRGAVTNMANDAFLEARSHLDMNGPVPLPMGDMPRGLLGLEQQVLDTHELTAAAAATYDRGLLRQAMLVDPIMNNIEDADAVIKETLERQKDALPEGWYRK